MFAQALMKKVAQMSQKFRPVVMQPEKIEDLMKKMEAHKQVLEQDRQQLNMTR